MRRDSGLDSPASWRLACVKVGEQIEEPREEEKDGMGHGKEREISHHQVHELREEDHEKLSSTENEKERE